MTGTIAPWLVAAVAMPGRAAAGAAAPADPLAARRAGAAKSAIAAFVARPGPDFVPVTERIAVFGEPR